MHAPWFAHYDEGIPRTLAPYPTRTLIDYLADWSRDHPNQPALLFKGAAISYGARRYQARKAASDPPPSPPYV